VGGPRMGLRTHNGAIQKVKRWVPESGDAAAPLEDYVIQPGTGFVFLSSGVRIATGFQNEMRFAASSMNVRLAPECGSSR